MSQESIYDFLKKHSPKKFYAKDLSKELGINSGSTCNALLKLKQKAKFYPNFRWEISKDGKYKIFLYWYDPKKRSACKEEVYL